MKILIADDEEMIRFGFISMIEEFKYKNLLIREASNGEETINICTEFIPDIAFIDIKMPKIKKVKSCLFLKIFSNSFKLTSKLIGFVFAP